MRVTLAIPSPNGDASWETQLASKFGSSWAIVSSQLGHWLRGLCGYKPGYLSIYNAHFNLKVPALLLMLFCGA